MIFKCYICGEVKCTCPDDILEEDSIEIDWMCGDCLWVEGSVFSCETFFSDLTEFILFEEVMDVYEGCN